MTTYYLNIYQNNTPSHYATIRSDWTDAEWEHLEETFPNGYFASVSENRLLYIKDIPKRHPNWREILPNFEETKDKSIGYVGGVPRVNPPAVIRDDDSGRERQKDIEKHRMYSDPDWNWSGLR